MGLVYHYTSPQGALGILQNKTLWFTDCEFMNDPAELAYCYKLYDRAWVEACREFGVPEAKIEREITRFANPYECESIASEATGAYVPARYYALSTCLNGDDPAMWANYAIKGGKAGYALAFDGRSLARALERLASGAPEFGFYVEVLYGQVQYTKEKQLENIKSAIRVHLERLAEAAGSTDELDRVLYSAMARVDHWYWFGDFAPFIKRPEFAYEQEYRYVLKMAQTDRLSASKAEGYSHLAADGERRKCSSDSNRPCASKPESPVTLHFREGFAGAITPYLEVRLGEAWVDTLSAVWGHAYTAPSLIKDGVSQLMEGIGYKDVSIQLSDIRLRG